MRASETNQLEERLIPSSRKKDEKNGIADEVMSICFSFDDVPKRPGEYQRMRTMQQGMSRCIHDCFAMVDKSSKNNRG